MHDNEDNTAEGNPHRLDSLESLLGGPLPWPKAEDRLVTRGDPDWHNSVMLHPRWSEPWSVYTDGYREAADIIVARINEGHRQQDSLVYPVMFLYRQYLELAIKNLIRKSWKLLGRDSTDDLGLHDIKKYWGMCRALLEEISPGESTAELGHVERLVDEFCQHDPNSFAFRYPESKPDGKTGVSQPTLQNLDQINLRNVHDVIANVAGLLSGADMQIDSYLDTQADMEAEYRPDRESW